MFINSIIKIIGLFILCSISTAAIADNKIVINGLSKHFNTPLGRNSYIYGLGYMNGPHEIGFYRNSRKPTTSFSIHYSWNRELTKVGKIPLGYRLGGALYDSAGPYDLYFKPIVA